MGIGSRLGCAWACLRGRPVMHAVDDVGIALDEDAASALRERGGLYARDCHGLRISAPAGTDISVKGAGGWVIPGNGDLHVRGGRVWVDEPGE